MSNVLLVPARETRSSFPGSVKIVDVINHLLRKSGWITLAEGSQAEKNDNDSEHLTSFAHTLTITSHVINSANLRIFLYMALRDRLAKVVRRWPDEATRKGDDLGSFLRKLYGLKATSIQSEVINRISTTWYVANDVIPVLGSSCESRKNQHKLLQEESMW